MHCHMDPMVMWTINDFSRYEILSRCIHQGYVLCLKCGPQSTFQHSTSLKKSMYMGHRKWFWHKHPYQLQQFNNLFDGQPEERDEPPIMMGNEVVVRGMEFQWWIRQGNRPRSANDLSKVYGVK